MERQDLFSRPMFLEDVGGRAIIYIEQKERSDMFKYINGYLKADTRSLADEACESARTWLAVNGYSRGGYWTDSYRNEFAAYTRAFMRTRKHLAGLAARNN